MRRLYILLDLFHVWRSRRDDKQETGWSGQVKELSGLHLLDLTCLLFTGTLAYLPLLNIYKIDGDILNIFSSLYQHGNVIFYLLINLLFSLTGTKTVIYAKFTDTTLTSSIEHNIPKIKNIAVTLIYSGEIMEFNWFGRKLSYKVKERK